MMSPHKNALRPGTCSFVSLMSLSPREVTSAFQSVPLLARIMARFLLQSVSTVGSLPSVPVPVSGVVPLGNSSESRFSPFWKIEDAWIRKDIRREERDGRGKTVKEER